MKSGKGADAVRANSEIDQAEIDRNINERAAPFNWRAYQEVHPAAELFPLLSDNELRDLAADIKVNGLQSNIIIWEDRSSKQSALLDGRNRLDAMALLGLLDVDTKGQLVTEKFCGHVRYVTGDPYAMALSFNVHRRHLTAEQRRDLIAKVLKAQPSQSNRTIAKQTKADDKTVASVRRDLEARAEIPNVETRSYAGLALGIVHRKRSRLCDVFITPPGAVAYANILSPPPNKLDLLLDLVGDGPDSKGRKQPSSKPKPAPRPTESLAPFRANDFSDEVDEDSGDEDEDIEAEVEPENYRTAYLYLLRVDHARRFAAYSGPVTTEFVAMARQVATAWENLAKQMEKSLGTSVSECGKAQSSPVTPAADADLNTIPGFLRRDIQARAQ